ncbi:MAG: hypothetical protein EXR79_02760 [Myxococcales bacterium]|nr:hypothetical protein [Myxococcales bacterium]
MTALNASGLSLGAIDRAATDYAAAILQGDPAVQTAARKGGRHGWRRRRVHIEFTFADVSAP